MGRFILPFFSTSDSLRGLIGEIELALGFSILLMLSGGESFTIRTCSGESYFRQRPSVTSSELNWILAVFSSSRIEPLDNFELNNLLKLYFLPSNDSLDILEVENIAWVTLSTSSTSAVRHITGLSSAIYGYSIWDPSWDSSSFIFSLIFDLRRSKFSGSFLCSKSICSSKLD